MEVEDEMLVGPLVDTGPWEQQNVEIVLRKPELIVLAQLEPPERVVCSMLQPVAVAAFPEQAIY